MLETTFKSSIWRQYGKGSAAFNSDAKAMKE